MVTFNDDIFKSNNPVEELIKKETQYNLQHYNFPVLHSSFGGKWLEDIPSDIQEILKYAHQVPLEIIVKPEDLDGHHWEIDFYILKEINGKYIRAIEHERNKKNKVLENGK